MSNKMQINIPASSLVVLIGASGSGKSMFARTHFQPTEFLSSDYCRGLVSDDENSQSATNDAFDVLQLRLSGLSWRSGCFLIALLGPSLIDYGCAIAIVYMAAGD